VWLRLAACRHMQMAATPDILFIDKVGGQYDEGKAITGTAAEVVEAGTAMVKINAAEAEYLVNCYPHDLGDVAITAEEPLALVTKPSEVLWQMPELVKLRGEDSFRFCPFTYE